MNFFILIFKKRVTYQKFLKYVAIFSILLLLLTAFVNYVVDPLWIFTHNNKFNSKQLSFNERQQKTNFLYFNKIKYDNVLIGSSRTTYIDPNAFNALGKTFNYAVNGLLPYEYKVLLDNFRIINGSEPKYIILGLDFFSTNKNKNKTKNEIDYLENTLSPLYSLKSLFNGDSFKYSIRTLKIQSKTKKAYYDRFNIKYLDKFDRKIIEEKMRVGFPIANQKNYIYDDKLKNEYLLLKKRYSDSKFIIFITPVIMDGLNKYKKLDLNKDYFLWLNDLIEVFGEVYTFMYPNSVTADIYNFFDPSHFFPDIGDKIALSIISNGNINYDFGIKLNKDNLEWFITKYNNNEFQKSIKEL